MIEFDNDFLNVEEVDTPVETETINENVEDVENTVDNSDLTEETSTEEQPIEQLEEIQKIKLKYNKQEMELPLTEVQALAQKGMNYDKVMEKLYQAENNPAINYLNELANRNGTTVDELVNYWREQEQQAELNQLIQSNIPEEYAREIMENRKWREQQQNIQKENEEKQRQELEFKDFFDSFQGVNPQDIPAEVWEKNQAGVPLKYAYMEYENQKIKAENKILLNNNTNKQKAVVTPTGNSSDENYDPFMDGWNSY